MGTRARTSCKRCGRDSDMTCPVTEPLEALLDALTNEAYEAHFNEIDEQMARSQLSLCTNCGARGNLTFTGMKNDERYRAFWTCRACGHWIEV